MNTKPQQKAPFTHGLLVGFKPHTLKKSINPALDFATQAHKLKDLKHFLAPYFTYRLYIQFHDQKKRHFYGNEHSVTYHQLVAGHATKLELDKQKGYTDLLKLVDKWRGQYIAAAIYSRPGPNLPFSILNRRYYMGEMQECNDPVAAEILQLEFVVDGEYMHIVPPNIQPPANEPGPGIGFKAEVAKALGKP